MMMGERLLSERKKSGLTLEQIAESLDITYQAYRKYERNICHPSINILVKLAKLYNVSTDYLLCLTDKRQELSPTDKKQESPQNA